MLLMNPDDIVRAGLVEGQMVSLVSDADDGVHRQAGPLKVTPFQAARRLRRLILSRRCKSAGRTRQPRYQVAQTPAYKSVAREIVT